MSFSVHADISGAMAAFRTLGNRKTADAALAPAVGRAAIRVQNVARASLMALVYETPEGAYKRTRTLYRSLHASNPRTPHGGDQARASGGMDLAASGWSSTIAASAASSVVRTWGLLYESEVGSWIDYAAIVHSGPHVRGPRPFMSPAAAQAAGILHDEIGRAVAAMIAQHVR